MHARTVRSNPTLQKLWDDYAQNLSSPKKSGSRLIELIGKEGCGSKRIALDFSEKNQKVVWLSSQWNIYAPLLWSIAASKNIQLLGIECPDSKRLRLLWRELFESQVFQLWILDHLKLKTADLFFLHHLISPSNLKVLILEEYPHSFCQERVHISLSHHSYRLQWSKGGPHEAQYKKAEYLQLIREELCLP